MKSSCDRERRSRSSSLSSHHSSKRDWSKSDKDDQSSSTHSSRDSYRSKSHSQSYSRGSSRSRTPSKSSSHSRSISKSRSTSKSGHQRTASKSPRRTTSQLSENKPVKTEPLRATVPQNENVVVQPVVAENIPVIPLSDSPPPSRWKPGQKPWKPSYERIQEMKAKTTHLLPLQSTYSLANIKETGSSSSYHKREKNSESDRSAYSKYSDRSSESSPRSRSRSSRSRSYSRSYTRSRSIASSHSRSRSASSRSHSRNKYSDHSQCSRSSSYSSVSSDDGRRAKRKFRSSGKKNSTSNRRHSSSSEKRLRNKYVKSREKSSSQRKYSESRSSLDDSSDSEQSSVQVTQSAQEKEKQVQVEMNNKQEKNRDEEKSKPGQECPRSKKRALKEKLSDHLRNGSKPKRKNYAGSRWDSESNSERDVTKNSKNISRPSSDKEEGEATSDSESEFGEIHSKAKPPTKSSAGSSLPDGNGAWKSSKRRSSTSDSEGSYSNSENTRRKARKHKHGSKENLKREQTKKAKEKLKGKKDKKHKAPKRKQAFHWQPPLEFGEEEEEEISEKQVTQEAKEKKPVSENSETMKENTPHTEKSCEEGSLSGKCNPVMTSSDADQPTKEDSKLNASPTAFNPEGHGAASPSSIQRVAEGVPSGVEDVLQTDDNMEICTPDRSSPAKEASPLGNSKLATPDISSVLKQDMHTEHPETEEVKQESSVSESKMMGDVGKWDTSPASLASAVESTVKREGAEKSQIGLRDNKWKPLQGVGNLAAPMAPTSSAMEVKALTAVPEMKPQGLRIEIKSKNKVRPGSLFDEVRKTARLNRRPRNQESSSDEQTPSRDGDSQSRSPSRSRSKSETKSRHRTRSVSYSHSRSRSRSSTSSYR